MEAMGADVSQKIRSAIKAKLIELGAYVDDELPDYIMVMVANKKSKAQMDEDLLLFLGSNTNKFTYWLHEVLERLQSVTSDVGAKKKATNTVQTGAMLSKDSVLDEEKVTTQLQQQKEEGEEAEVQDEVLAIKAEFEADDLLAEEIQSNEKIRGTQSSKVLKQQHVVVPVQRVNVEEAQGEEQQVSRGTKRVHPSVNTITPKRRAPSSMVGAILSRDDDYDEDDNVYTGGLASIVKISQRRSSIPVRLQANKNLVMKAVAEAKKSVLDAAKKQTRVEQYELPSGPALFTRKYKCKPVLSNKYAAVVHPNQTLADDKDASPPKVQTIIPSLEKFDHINEGDMVTSMEKRHYIQESEDGREIGPKFIVTLDGIDPNSFPKKQNFAVLKGARSVEMDDENDSDMIIDEYDDETVTKRSLEDTNKTPDRCKYWPTCKNGNECAYHHPNKPCKTFPNCRFGERCYYIHPNCKYDATCTKGTCPFTHASRRILAQVPAPLLLTTKAQFNQKEKKCRFFPNCTNLNCTFYHPKPCRYGLGCTQQGCSFSHPPLPSRDKLKWSANPSNTATSPKKH